MICRALVLPRIVEFRIFCVSTSPCHLSLASTSSFKAAVQQTRLPQPKMADIESMYAMLCDVQQCAAQEEETMKQLKVDVVRLREAKEALSASFQALQSETNVQRALVDQHTKEIEVAQFDMRTSLEVCHELRRARLATFDASAQLTDEAYAVWKQMMDGLRSRAALHA